LTDVCNKFVFVVTGDNPPENMPPADYSPEKITPEVIPWVG